jgi:hypothetical protein
MVTWKLASKEGSYFVHIGLAFVTNYVRAIYEQTYVPPLEGDKECRGEK